MSARGFLILALLASTASAFAIPLLNPRPSNNTVFEESFTSEPRGRGTVTLLTSCFLTFGFCVWTSVHPNIIPCSKGEGQFTFKLLWMTTAIFFPEIVMMCALGERRQAETVAVAYNSKFSTDHASDNPDAVDKPKMSLAEGFFVVMGGFTAKDSDGKTFTLTPTGFIEYVESGRITDAMIDIPTINDKGNASGFTKLITFFQALWFIFRCASRWYQKFPVTLLERHVAIQVLFTLFTCIFWWYKPLDVICPISLTLTVPRPPPEDEICTPYPSLAPRETASHRDPRPATPYESTHYMKARNFVYQEHLPGFFSLFLKVQYDSMRYNITGRISDMFWIFIPLLFNGLWHLFAWDVDFPTPLEETLWAVSCLIMCGSAFVYTMLGMMQGAQQFLLSIQWEAQFIHEKSISGTIALFRHLMEINQFRRWKRLLMLLMLALFLSYVSAVSFILVESGISMRRLAKGSYAIAPLYESNPSGGSKNFW